MQHLPSARIANEARAQTTANMARSKQAMPVKRATSSEYISKHDRFPKNSTDLAARVKDNVQSLAAGARDEPGSGMLQLLICVGGIYASL